ncbi:MAG: hypothetical protein R2911_04695 [Caldilineaceae bacterium]
MRAACVAPAGMGVSLRRPLCEWGHWPVQKEMRAGIQSGCGVKAWRKSTPLAASRARWGVWQKGLPYRWLLRAFCWSVMMTRMLGRCVMVDGGWNGYCNTIL